MTQPTISRRMEDFEFRLRAKLFERSSRGVVLTDAGFMVRDLAQSMARYGGSIVREVAGHDNSQAGRVRLVAPDGIAGFVLAPRLAKLQMTNPQVQLTIDCGLWIGSMLEAEPRPILEMTDAYSPGPDLDPDRDVMHYAAFASREYLDLYGDAGRPSASSPPHRTVRHTSHREQRVHLDAEGGGRSATGSRTTSSATLSAATLQAVRAGCSSIASLPTFVATFAPELVMLDLGPWGHPLLFLRYHSGVENQRRVKLVKDWLMDVFDPTDQPWFREEFVHPRDFPRYMPEAPETARPPRRAVRGAAG